MISKKFARGGTFVLALVILAFSAAGVGIASADNDSPPATAPASNSALLTISIGQSSLGTFLTGPEGHTLYVFKKDAFNVSNCNAACLTTWPSLLLSEGQSVSADASAVGNFGLINTPSGTQVTYNGAPLYYYAGDANVGDTNGDGVGGLWSVARPNTSAPTGGGVQSNNVPGGYADPGAGMGGY